MLLVDNANDNDYHLFVASRRHVSQATWQNLRLMVVTNSLSPSNVVISSVCLKICLFSFTVISIQVEGQVKQFMFPLTA